MRRWQFTIRDWLWRSRRRRDQNTAEAVIWSNVRMQRYVTRFYIKDMIYALVIVGMYFAWHRDVLQCRLEQDQYRIA